MGIRIDARVTSGLTNRLVMIMMTLILFACQPVDTFRPPTRSELEAFFRDQGITVLNQLSFDDSTLLLYEKGTSFGYYTLSVREPAGEMVLNQLSATKSSDPILVMGQSSGAYPFVAVILQDPTLLAKTTTIEVSAALQSPLTVSTNGQASVILVSPSLAAGWNTVTLYNAQGEVLYTQGG